MQLFLDWFYYGRKFVMDGITFLSMRFFGIECAFNDVKKRVYAGHPQVNLNLEAIRKVVLS